MCVACLAFRLFSCATPAYRKRDSGVNPFFAPFSCDHSDKIKNKNKINIKKKNKGAGYVSPVGSCGPSVVRHQLLGMGRITKLHHTQPQL